MHYHSSQNNSAYNFKSDSNETTGNMAAKQVPVSIEKNKRYIAIFHKTTIYNTTGTSA